MPACPGQLVDMRAVEMASDAMALQQRQPPVRYSDEINDKLIKWMNETGYSIVQINGQRISSSPRLDRKPSRDCEVFVGKIPRDCYEDELFPIFQRAGHIHELRLMMMFSGTNRGYAFVMYENLLDAQRAVDHLNNYEIRRGHRIGVLPCVNNCRLFIGCFEPEERSEMRFQEVLWTETEYVQAVTRRSGRNGRWYLLVEYLNHRAAAIARRELTPRRVQLFGPRVLVDWEIPLDKRGRKLYLDDRRALRGPTALKMLKPIAFGQPEVKASKKSRMLMDREDAPNCGGLMLVPRDAEETAQCGPYQNVWIPKQAPPHHPYYWQMDVLQYDGFNQSPSSCSEWNTAGPTVRRPLTRQSSLENSSKSTLSQESDCNNFHSCLYRQLVTSSRQNLMRSVDSGLYSDPESCRPISSDSSTGSAHSSFSMSGTSCVSSWDSLDSANCTTPGSSNNSCAVSWNRSLSNDVDFDHHDTGNHQLFKKELQPSASPPMTWHTEDQQANLSTDVRRNGIWSSHFQSPEDHQLIDDLFMKKSGVMAVSSADQDVNIPFNSLSLSRHDDISKKTFDRAIQPPQPRISQQGSLNHSSFKKGF